MTYPVVDRLDREGFPVETACRLLAVSTSGFYEWRRRPLSARAQADAQLLEHIRAAYQLSRGTYGSPRVHAELKLGLGIACGRKRVERLMRTAGIEGVSRRRRRGCTRRDPTAAPADDLVERVFGVDGPDRLWVADITQHRTGEGWLYGAFVIDAWSRRVLGWSLGEHCRTDLVVDALEMALWRRQGADGCVHHSDHGCQGNTPAGRSGTGSAKPACAARWAPSATPTTTPWPKASSPACKPSSSTAVNGPAEPS
jgi:hypothetical protein